MNSKKKTPNKLLSLRLGDQVNSKKKKPQKTKQNKVYRNIENKLETLHLFLNTNHYVDLSKYYSTPNQVPTIARMELTHQIYS